MTCYVYSEGDTRDNYVVQLCYLEVRALSDFVHIL